MSDGAQHPFSLSQTQLFLLVIAIGLGTFVDILDTSIANVAIPYIAGSFGSMPTEGTWVITSYAISSAIAIPLTGRFITRLGESRLFIIAVLLFSLFSLACALSWSLFSLIVFRVLQGFAGGALLPVSQSLLLHACPKRQQGVAMGIFFAVIVSAPILGPLLGGWLTDYYSWPWIFYINVPLGLLSAFLVYTLVGCGEGKRVKKKYDFVGFFFLAIMVGALQICFDRGHDLEWFQSSYIIGMACLSLVAMLFFVVWDIYTDDPLIDLSYLKNRNFTFGVLTISLGFALFFGGTVLLPLWLQTQQGYPALLAGLSVAPLGIAPLVLGIPIGYLVTRIDARWLVTLGALIFSGTFFWFASFNTEVSLSQLLMSRAVQGIGIAFFVLPITTIALAEVPEEKYGHAVGLFHFIRISIACGIATALLSSAWQRWGQIHYSRLTEAVTPFSPITRQMLDQMHNLSLNEQAGAQFVNHLIEHQAIMLATNDLFWLAGWLSLVIIPMVWFCRYKPSGGMIMFE